MDLVTGQRTYVVGVSGTLTAHTVHTVDIPFTDTSGQLINCNYCKVQLGSAGAAGKSTAAILELSGLSREGDMVTNTLSGFQDDANLGGSGILGIGVCNGYLAANNVAEWHGSNGEVATGVKVQLHSSDTTYRMILTYGNLYPLNTLRLEQSYDKGK